MQAIKPICFILLGFVLYPALASAQTGTIAGEIRSAETGEPLPGANIMVKGTSVGAAAGEDGRYRLLRVPAGEQTVVVSFVGFQGLETTINIDPGETVTRNFSLESMVLEGGEVVVTGQRRGQVKSIAEKMAAPSIKDVVSADEIGKLPERNVAEAVSRLPGVSLETSSYQTARGGGRFVTIRGSGAALNNVTINGHTMASTAESRATALDLLPAAMVSSVEVIKGITPDMPGTGIGGAINTNTLSALDRNRSFVFGTVEGLLHDQQVPTKFSRTGVPHRASLTAGIQFGPQNDKLGIVLSGTSSRQDRSVSTFAPQDWRPVEGAESIFVPEEQESYVEENDLERQALTASLDYRPGSRTNLHLRSYYTHTLETRIGGMFEFNYLGSNVISERDMTVRYDSGFVHTGAEIDTEDESLWGTTVEGEHQFSAFTWEASGTYTRGVLSRTNRDAEFGTNITDGVSTVVDVSNSFFDVYPENPQFVKNPANYFANEFDREIESNVENTWVGTTDLQWDTRVGPLSGFLKTGVNIRRRDKVIDDNENQYGRGDTPVTMESVYEPPHYPIQGGTTLYMLSNPSAVDEMFRELCGKDGLAKFSEEADLNCSSGTEHFTYNGSEARAEAVENDSDNREFVYAGYLMENLKVGDLTVIGGARLEHTSTEVNRWQLLTNEDTGEGTIEPQVTTSSYTNFLPSLHLKYFAGNSLLLRGVWSNTIGRPDYADLAGFREVEFQEVAPGTFYGSVEEGNPNLKPYKAMNFDAAAEYYFQSGGLLALSGFYKLIDDPIYTFQRTAEDVVFEDRAYERLEFERDENAEQGTIAGIEANYQQSLIFLPAPLDGLGLSANVTLVDSEVNVPSRAEDNLSFFSQSDVTYNVIPYFQKSGFEFRTAVNYRSSYLDELGDSSIEDEYAGDRRTIDITASYRFGEQLVSGLGDIEIIMQVINLTNEPATFYLGDPEKPGQLKKKFLGAHILSGRTMELGISMSF